MNFLTKKVDKAKELIKLEQTHRDLTDIKNKICKSHGISLYRDGKEWLFVKIDSKYLSGSIFRALEKSIEEVREKMEKL